MRFLLPLLLILSLSPVDAQPKSPEPPTSRPTSQPASKPAKAPSQLQVTAGQSVRLRRTGSIEVLVRQGKRQLRKHAATFDLTYTLEVQAATKKQIVWTIAIEAASGTESGEGEVKLGPATWALEKRDLPLSVQVSTDRAGRLRGAENAKALLILRRATGSDVFVHYLWGDDPTSAGEADGPLTALPLLPAKPSAAWRTKSGQAYGFLVSDAAPYRETWAWKASAGPKGRVVVRSKSLTLTSIKPASGDEAKLTSHVTNARAEAVLDKRTGLPISASRTVAFELRVAKLGLTMAFKRQDRVRRPPAKRPR